MSVAPIFGGLGSGGTPGGGFNPLAHPNLAALFDLNDLDSVETTSGTPGTEDEDIVALSDLSGNGHHLDGGSGARPILRRTAGGFYYAENPLASSRHFVDTLAMPCATVVVAARIYDATAAFAGFITARDDLPASETGGVFRPNDSSPTAWTGTTDTGFDMCDGSRIFTDGVNTNSVTVDTDTVWSRDGDINTNANELAEGVYVFRRNINSSSYTRGRVYRLAFFDAILSDADRQEYEDWAAGGYGGSL